MDKGVEYSDDKIIIFYGMTSSQTLFVGYFLNQNFMMLFLQIIAQNIILTLITWNPSFLQVRWAYFCSSFLILLFLYEQIRLKKNNFQLYQSEQEWAHIIKNGLSSPIMTVRYNQKENFIQMEIINNKAQKQFGIKTSEEFKAFSRMVKVFSKEAIIDEILEQEQLTVNPERKSIGNQERQAHLDFTQQNDTAEHNQALTFENQIILLIKNQIVQEKTEKRFCVNISSSGANNRKIIDQNNNKNLNQKTQNLDNQQQQQQSIYQYNCIYNPSKERSLIQKFSVKLSIFQQQSQYNCCIVVEEESSDQKIKRLQKMYQKQQSNFMIQFLHMWTKLKATIEKQSNQNIIRSYIKLALNQINNIKTHMQQIKKQTVISKQEYNKETFLKEIVDNISQTFYQFKDQLKFEFSNCTNQTFICSNVPRICQILTNLIENSLKYQLYPTNTIDYSNSTQDQTLQFNTQQLIDSPQTSQNTFIKHSPSYLFLKQNEITFTECHDSYRTLAINMSENKRSSRADILVSPRLQKNIVRIKFDLIKGENEISNVIKVSIKDNNQTTKISDLQNILILIANKLQNSDYYKEFKHLGWKVSLNLIGKIGPFYDIFLNPNYVNGIQIHFYIYQNINILDQNNKDVFFKNKNFDIEYAKSNQFCYNTQRKTLCQKQELPVISMSNISIQLDDSNNKQQNPPKNEDDLSTLPQLNIDELVQPVHKGYISDRFILDSIKDKQQSQN
ncbi:transmembrane protein, putative (macronuclear) [Tetrahymena thermophila SB210]|uniref:Transmembrane protein, putative n=1 Tax=Tetrahymena thermophila (strain SB210) TaxID=312017 RepID=Q22WV0_TETTS|nr:transmembrane protein, putative [Tetrahymena thermophila SB210]EAR89763.2 transmembrane protein, putative [Tetrahymena thermophila SB210]|eukprot:XP_001010008.2 transmembrane protein, putative [Tetrahymena thermophila SB210]